ncbi:MAG: nitroreductase family protein [Deltaproteobacteria bacterium]|nr:nitroreductase family protein [Desulfitobacteriaceae bacterium]MDI6854769.1 nitroreductase family protein [Deltaproteobacteria bacterium]
MQISDSPILKAIHERRSVRQFMEAPVSRDLIMTAIEAASWAPSGLNNQPWRFAIIWDKALREALAALTRYANILQSASVLIGVFLDKENSYDYTKDCQAVGACLQNLLLALHSLDLGAVWIGEILKNKERVIEILKLPEQLELMAVVAVGHPAHRNQKSHRLPLDKLILLEK